MRVSARSVRTSSLIAMGVGFALLAISAWLLIGRYAYAEYSQPQLIAPNSNGSLSAQDPGRFSADQLTLVRNPKVGEYFAVITIPALGDDWQRGVVQGTSQGVLNRLGLGHYESTPFPDEQGNFSLAGHSGNRWTPFYNLKSVKNGDLIYVETIDTKYEYVVRDIKVVESDQVEVIKSIPRSVNKSNSKNWITLTTCKEDGDKDLRLIVHGELKEMNTF